MTDPNVYLTVAAAGLAGLGMVTAAGLAAFRGWLQLKGEQMRGPLRDIGGPGASARIEIADLKERIRKLEAIAAGVDL